VDASQADRAGTQRIRGSPRRNEAGLDRNFRSTERIPDESEVIAGRDLKTGKENMTTKNNLAEAVIIERTFNAPVARVWKALTDVDEMRLWYFDLKEFNPEPGFEFEFIVEHEGMKYHHLCKITEVIPQRKIAYTWRYKGHEGDSLVTFELFAEGDKTRLKLTHEGLETFPKTPAFARKNFEAGWTAIIGSELKQFLEGKQKGRS
jgi:uncharacterized protein YndB with AHSA1/START domain